MTTAQIVIGIILLVFAVFLIVAVLMQQGKSHNLSGTIAGGAETFFGKSKAQTINKKLSVLTTVVAIVFVLLVGTVYTGDINGFSWNNFKTTILGSTEKTEDSVSVEDKDADTADSADDSADADSAEDSAE